MSKNTVAALNWIVGHSPCFTELVWEKPTHLVSEVNISGVCVWVERIEKVVFFFQEHPLGPLLAHLLPLWKLKGKKLENRPLRPGSSSSTEVSKTKLGCQASTHSLGQAWPPCTAIRAWCLLRCGCVLPANIIGWGLSGLLGTTEATAGLALRDHLESSSWYVQSPFIKYLLWPKYNAKHFICIISFQNPKGPQWGTGCHQSIVHVRKLRLHILCITHFQVESNVMARWSAPGFTANQVRIWIQLS